MHTVIAVILAVCAALTIAVGSVLRQRASADTGAITPGWWLGAGIAIVGFGLQGAALGLGSVLVVQPLLVFSVLFALPLEAWFDSRRPEMREWMWGTVLAISVVSFLLLVHPEATGKKPSPLVMLAVGIVAVIVLLTLVVIGERSTEHYRALCYGLTAGSLFGISALMVKSVIQQIADDWTALPLRPEPYILVVTLVCGIVAQQRGFGSGDLQTSFPAMTVMEPAVSMGLGVLLFGETVSISTLDFVLIVVILAVMVRAVTVLARMSAIRDGSRGVLN